MQIMVRLLLVIFLLCGLGMKAGEAQTTTPPETKKTVVIDKRKLLVQPRNADGTIVETPFMEDPVLWMRTKQQNFYGRMANAMRGLKASSSNDAAWSLLIISFFYGVFHAAGPGHGKAVVTGWLLATENELKRGILVAFMSAMVQALTAIIVVSLLLLVVSGASAAARDVAGFLESASYAMIAGMGLYLVWIAGQSLRPVAQHQLAQGPFELVSRPVLEAGHVHSADCGCGHAPSAAEVAGPWSWRQAFAMSFAVGIRPCSGALLVLVASSALGLFWAGVASTLAMGFGVFLTVATIASTAVYAKSTALRLTRADNPWTALAVQWGKLGLGVIIACFGGLLFWSSLGSNVVGM